MSTAEDPNLKTREEKDADLDRKIEALRKKNEALMKRHKEIEEDRRKAEEDGISVTNRKPRHEAEHDRKWSEKDILTVTVDLSKSPSEWEEKRRQNIEQMNEEMEKIAEYERNQMDGSGEKNPMRNFLDDPRRLGSLPDADRKDGSRRHIRNWGGPDFDKVKTGLDRDKDWQGRRSGSKGSVDMTLSMTGRERAEYMRWKKERERIDQERLARHRNATGQWRREWDAEKTESISVDNSRNVFGKFRVLFSTVRTHSEKVGKDGENLLNERRPPKPPTISDFVAHSRDKDSRRGKDKRGGKNYSMHDDRWEAGEAAHEPKQISEDQQEKRFKGKPAQDVKLSELKANKEELLVDAVDDEDEWEDASDDEEEIVGEDVSDSDGELEETKELEEKQEAKGIKEEVEMEVETVQHVSRSPEIDAKQQRVRKARESPKLHIPPMEETVQFKETAPKPLSPFSLEEYHPVKDWAEEMETSSPRCNVEQNPLQTVNTAKEECKVENKQGDIAADRESLPSDVQTGMEPVSVREPSPLQYGTESNQPTAEILNAHVDPDIRDGDQSSDSATIVATQAATEEELKQQEVNRREDGFLEPSTRTTRSTDCVEDNEHSSGSPRALE
ncbi:hypothetical protein scyTo_0017953 [Scyliorhinus torazame]|uniref:Coiled-coil domain-containing protein 9 n=1 Tax=Scyliorhinus torazame TaxID=75743 RepID=A0A401Q366_SCYTO|nr:hypothetical protein [Scyliorhinus torazame]